MESGQKACANADTVDEKDELEEEVAMLQEEYDAYADAIGQLKQSLEVRKNRAQLLPATFVFYRGVCLFSRPVGDRKVVGIRESAKESQRVAVGGGKSGAVFQQGEIEPGREEKRAGTVSGTFAGVVRLANRVGRVEY